MKKLLITQRTDFIDSHQEVRDSLDTRLVKIIIQLNMLPILMPNLCKEKSIKNIIDNTIFDGLILSGGNTIGSQKSRDKTEIILIKHCIENKIPIFGICRGMQMLAKYNGSKISKVTGHVNQRHILEGIAPYAGRNINSYHNYGIKKDDLSKEFDALAWTNDGCIKAIKHKSYPWLGIAWHPEREINLLEFDINLISNHFC